MFDKEAPRNSTEQFLRKAYLTWLVWAALGFVAWFFWPTSGDAPGGGFELLAHLALFCFAQLPFSVVVLAASFREWSGLSGGFRFFGCATLLTTIGLVLVGGWWFFSFFW